ncbi:MAG: hypothetical protein U0736_19515 [Gemmataceae bacterium]
MTDPISRWIRRAAVAPLLLVAALAAGCGGSAAGQAAGQVKYRGKPLTEGEVHFYSQEKGVGAVAKITGTGQFVFDAPLPVGTYLAAIQPSPPEPGMPPARSVALIPTKYRDPKRSSLTFQLKAGRNDCPIELAD